jgi:hypothetical protein
VFYYTEEKNLNTNVKYTATPFSLCLNSTKRLKTGFSLFIQIIVKMKLKDFLKDVFGKIQGPKTAWKMARMSLFETPLFTQNQ